MKRLLPVVAMLFSLAVLLSLSGYNSTVQPPLPATRAQRWTAHRPVQPAAPPPSTPEAASSTKGRAIEDLGQGAERSKEPQVQSFNTGDCETWPRYDFPLVIQIDPPPVPPEITAPTPAIVAP